MSLISVGEIIDRSWHHYTKYFVELMSISVWLLLVAIINTVATWLYPAVSNSIGEALTVSEKIGVLLYAVNFLLFTPIITVWVSNTTIRLLDRQVQGKPVSLKELSREGARFFFPRLLVGVLFMVCLLTPMILLLPGLLVSIVGDPVSPILGFAGSMLFVCGFFVAIALSGLCWVRLFFSAYTLLLQQKRGRDALRSSWELTKRRGWPVFWRIVIPKAVFFFGFFSLQIFLTTVLQTLAGNLAGLNFELGVRLYAIGSTTIFLLLGALLHPLLASADYLLFKSLQEQN